MGFLAQRHVKPHSTPETSPLHHAMGHDPLTFQAVEGQSSCTKSRPMKKRHMTLIHYELFSIAVTGFLVILALPFASDRRPAPLFAFVGIAAAWTAVVGAPHILGWQFGSWNWVGKSASICVGLAMVVLLRLGREEVGLILPADRRAWLVTAAGIGSAVLFFVCLTIVFGPNSRPDIQTLAFQATLPGLDEELVFRGIGMALLTRGLERLRFGLPRWFFPLVITSLWFLADHIVNIDRSGLISLMPSALISVLPMGVILALTRIGSGSLLGPVIAHNAANTAGYLMAFVLPASH